MWCTEKNEQRCFEALLDTPRLTHHLAWDLKLLWWPSRSKKKTSCLPRAHLSLRQARLVFRGHRHPRQQNHQFMCCFNFGFSNFFHFPLPFCHKNQKGHKRILQFSDHHTGISRMIQIILAAVSPLPLLSVLWRQQPLLAPWNTPVHWKREAHLSDGPKKNEILNRIRSFNQMEVKWLVSDKEERIT